MKSVLRVLMAASEADPFIKVGGLADVTGSLPHALKALPKSDEAPELDVRLAIPFHPVIRSRIPEPPLLTQFMLLKAGSDLPVSVYQVDSNGIPVYLIDGPPISREFGVYTGDPDIDGEKYVFFSLALLEMARVLDWKPDILHAHDWHTSPAVYELSRLRSSDDFFRQRKSLLTIHNLPFMGIGVEDVLKSYGISPIKNPALPKWARMVPLAMGLASADFINAVSPTYSQEIMTKEHGCGLQDFLKSRSDSIAGIINGLDLDLWNPAADKAIHSNFDLHTLNDRAANKKVLQAEFGLPQSAEVPLIVMIGRLDRQKGIDLAIESLNRISTLPWQAVTLGTGDPYLEEACTTLEMEFPDRVRAAIRFDGDLARRMYAGGDILLMPSRYEPSGLAQMIAMHYGCVPVARATGGLKDSIIDFAEPEHATGFLFKAASANDLSTSLKRALNVFRDQAVWKSIQMNGMKEDFSWKNSAKAYLDIYLRLTA